MKAGCSTGPKDFDTVVFKAKKLLLIEIQDGKLYIKSYDNVDGFDIFGYWILDIGYWILDIFGGF